MKLSQSTVNVLTNEVRRETTTGELSTALLDKFMQSPTPEIAAEMFMQLAWDLGSFVDFVDNNVNNRTDASKLMAVAVNRRHEWDT